jgi:Mrp family chromosome partitioning ATPase
MAKLLETLRQVNRPSAAPAPVLPVPSAKATAEPLPRTVADEEWPEEETPFIEVGGPGKKVESSKALSAAINQALPTKTTITPAPLAAPLKKPAAPLTVVFEAWPNGKLRPIAPEIITYHQPDHPVSKQYAALFQSVTEGLGKSPVLLFVGGTAGSGATTVLLNLAFSACRQKRRVALIDANLRRPAVAERLGLAASPGWSDLLAGRIGLEKALQKTAEPHLCILHAGTAASQTGMPPEAFQWVTGWIRERFDFILIDAPDVGSGDLKTFISSADGLYLILPQGTPESERLNEMTQNIVRMGGHLRGLIHTHFQNL